ncbi:MAG: TIM barrel protein [Kiritimatiellales bacterium]
MLKTGICSITFRQFSIEKITNLAKKAGLDAIEWGSDIHVPPGDIDAAEKARKITSDAGLEISSYGSYYRILDETQEQIFQPFLDSALTLGTDTLRIWAGNQSSELISEKYRQTLVEKLRQDLDLASSAGVRLALEFHVSSLTDSNASAQKLLKEVSHPNLYLYWQPVYWLADFDYRLQGLNMLKDRIINLHVFNWQFNPSCGNWGENIIRRPLEKSEAEWKRYFSVPLSEGIHYALMEFVPHDDPEQFLIEAQTFRRLVS